MNQFEVRDAIIKVLKEHAIVVDKDCAEDRVNDEIIISPRWIAGRVINEIKNERDKDKRVRDVFVEADEQ